MSAADLLVIGDRPGKDVAVAAALGERPIRKRTGEHADAPSVPRPTAGATLAGAAELVLAG